jgi:hypothetical protein
MVYPGEPWCGRTREDQMAHRHWRAVRRLATTMVIGALALAAVASLRWPGRARH